jgi:hypothetical protein
MATARYGLPDVGDGHGLLECSTEHRVEIAVASDLHQWQLLGIRMRSIFTGIHLKLTLRHYYNHPNPSMKVCYDCHYDVKCMGPCYKMLFTRRDGAIMSVIKSRPVVTMQQFLLNKLLLPQIERLPSKTLLIPNFVSKTIAILNWAPPKMGNGLFLTPARARTRKVAYSSRPSYRCSVPIGNPRYHTPALHPEYARH